jgi:hypothetical protein
MTDLPETYDELLDLLPEEGLTAIDRRRTRRLPAARAALTLAEAELVVAVREPRLGEEGRLARREEREREREPERSDGRESTA